MVHSSHTSGGVMHHALLVAWMGYLAATAAARMTDYLWYCGRLKSSPLIMVCLGSFMVLLLLLPFLIDFFLSERTEMHHNPFMSSLIVERIIANSHGHTTDENRANNNSGRDSLGEMH